MLPKISRVIKRTTNTQSSTINRLVPQITHSSEALKKTSPNKRDKKADELKVMLCAFAKCENRYLSEWVDYNLGIGFDNIFLFDNNEKNGEKPQDVLNEEQKKKVHFIDVRGMVETAVKLQTKCYEKCYGRIPKDYDWVGFLDI